MGTVYLWRSLASPADSRVGGEPRPRAASSKLASEPESRRSARALRWGLTRPEVRAGCGAPELWGYPPTTEGEALVWKYGDVEVHFGDDGRVRGLFFELERKPRPVDGGRAFQVVDGRVLVASRLTPKTVEQRLRQAGVPFWRGVDYVGQPRVDTPAAELAFTLDDDDRGPALLAAVWAGWRRNRVTIPVSIDLPWFGTFRVARPLLRIDTSK